MRRPEAKASGLFFLPGFYAGKGMVNCAQEGADVSLGLNGGEEAGSCPWGHVTESGSPLLKAILIIIGA